MKDRFQPVKSLALAAMVAFTGASSSGCLGKDPPPTSTYQLGCSAAAGQMADESGNYSGIDAWVGDDPVKGSLGSTKPDPKTGLFFLSFSNYNSRYVRAQIAKPTYTITLAAESTSQSTDAADGGIYRNVLGRKRCP